MPVHNHVLNCSQLTDDDKQLCKLCANVVRSVASAQASSAASTTTVAASTTTAAASTTTTAAAALDDGDDLADVNLDNLVISDPDFAQIHEPERDISSAPSAIGAESRVHLMRSLADRKVSLVKNLLKANAILKVNSSERCAKMKKAWDVYAPVFEKNFQATAVIAATTKLPSTKYVSEHDVNVTKCEQAWSHHWREPGSMWPFQLHDEQLSESGGKKKQKKTKTKSTKAAAKRPRKSHDPDDDVDDKLLPATATSVDGDDNADDDAGDDDADDGDDGEDDDANGFGQYVDGNTGADADLTIADGQLYLRERERLLSANEKNVKMREEFLVEKFAVEIRGRNIRRRLAQAADLLTDACPYCGDTNVITRPPEARQRHMLRCSKENPIQLATDDDEHKP